MTGSHSHLHWWTGGPSSVLTSFQIPKFGRTWFERDRAIMLYQQVQRYSGLSQNDALHLCCAARRPFNVSCAYCSCFAVLQRWLLGAQKEINFRCFRRADLRCHSTAVIIPECPVFMQSEVVCKQHYQRYEGLFAGSSFVDGSSFVVYGAAGG